MVHTNAQYFNIAISLILMIPVPCQDCILTLPTLGRNGIRLGGLYSEVEDKFLPGMSLWSAEDIQAHTSVSQHGRQRSVWTSGLELQTNLHGEGPYWPSPT